MALYWSPWQGTVLSHSPCGAGLVLLCPSHVGHGDSPSPQAWLGQVAPTGCVGVTGVSQDVQPKPFSLDEPSALGRAGEGLCPAAPHLCFLGCLLPTGEMLESF